MHICSTILPEQISRGLYNKSIQNFNRIEKQSLSDGPETAQSPGAISQLKQQNVSYFTR